MQDGVEIEKIVGLAAILIYYRREFCAIEYDKKRLERAVREHKAKPTNKGGRGKNLFTWKRNIKVLESNQAEIMECIGDCWDQLDEAVGDLAAVEQPGFAERIADMKRHRIGLR